MGDEYVPDEGARQLISVDVAPESWKWTKSPETWFGDDEVESHSPTPDVHDRQPVAVYALSAEPQTTAVASRPPLDVA
jgi:hypothetical protein